MTFPALLAGYVAVDLSDLAGQLCGKLLADLGVRVIKVEAVTGDAVRSLPPFAQDEPDPEGSLRFAFLNSGKESIAVDIESADGRKLLHDLIERADVLIESLSPARLTALGLDEASMAARNADMVRVSLTGFGKTGPRNEWQAPDLVAVAMGGLMYISGDPNLPPCRPPETQGYYYAGMYGALAAILAVWSGPGSAVADLSVQEAVASQEHLIRTWLEDGHNIERAGSQHKSVVPAGLFPTRDGFVYLFAARYHWPILLRVWDDHPADLDSPRWLPNSYRRANAATLNPLIEAFTSRYESAALVDRLQEAGVPCLPVQSPDDFLHDAHIRARGLFGAVRHPRLGEYEQVSFPAVVDGLRMPVFPPPLLGEDTARILLELGRSQAEIDRLERAGTIVLGPVA